MYKHVLYGGCFTPRGSIDGQLLYTQEEANEYHNRLNEAKVLHQLRLISDVEIVFAEALADEAQRGVTAFENMTLSQALGVL